MLQTANQWSQVLHWRDGKGLKWKYCNKLVLSVLQSNARAIKLIDLTQIKPISRCWIIQSMSWVIEMMAFFIAKVYRLQNFQSSELWVLTRLLSEIIKHEWIFPSFSFCYGIGLYSWERVNKSSFKVVWAMHFKTIQTRGRFVSQLDSGYIMTYST